MNTKAAAHRTGKGHLAGLRRCPREGKRGRKKSKGCRTSRNRQNSEVKFETCIATIAKLGLSILPQMGGVKKEALRGGQGKEKEQSSTVSWQILGRKWQGTLFWGDWSCTKRKKGGETEMGEGTNTIEKRWRV